MKWRQRERDSWQFWFGCESPSPSTGTRSVSATARSTTICYIPWQYDSALQQSLVTVHSARLQPHGSVEPERINNCDPKALGKKKKEQPCWSWSVVPHSPPLCSITFLKVWAPFRLCSAAHRSPTFFHATFYPVLSHSIRAQYENKWEQWLWKRF